jgi:hypothetical protein
MTKIVAKRSADGRIVMLPRPDYTAVPSKGDIRSLRGQYQEFRQPSMLNGYWRDVTAEVAAVLRQTFVADAATVDAPQEPTL